MPVTLAELQLIKDKREAASAMLMKALAFIDKASGTALGIAMSGRNHPNPDGVLTDLAEEGMDLSAEIRAALKRATEG